MNKDALIIGVSEKYPDYLLEGRTHVEGNLLACMMKDLTLIDDIELTRDDFLTSDGLFYYCLMKDLRKKGINTLDEVSILSNSTEQIINGYDNRGGWNTIQDLIDIVDEHNADNYLDNLMRENNFIKLYNGGFDLTKKVEINGKTIPTIDLLRRMTAQEVIEYYESRLTLLETGSNNKILEETGLEITDDFIESLGDGSLSGVPFDYCGEDVEGNEVLGLPYISSHLDGYLRGTLNMCGGFSSVGKTTLMCSILLGLASQGEKILIISNEQKSNVFKLQFLMWVLAKKLKYTNLTKTKIKNKEIYTDKDNEMIRKAKEIWNKEFKKQFHFIHIADADINLVKKTIRKYHLIGGYSCFTYDTFKLDVENLDAKIRTDIGLIKDSRELDKIAKQYDMIGLANVQLAESMKGNLFLSANVLSNSKQIKEILESLLLIRSVYTEELMKDNKKFYCKPFKRKKVGGVWIEEEYEPDLKAVYRMLFFEKTRSNSNSSDTGLALLLKFEGHLGIFKEAAWCRPRHGQISN